MRLINTETFELKFFISPENVPGGYAILSHCWAEEGEQTFKELAEIHERVATSGQDSPRALVSEKIRRFCELASSHGYQWAWIDTCCIDKTSSSELSEAINSMYQYYSLADICYAYLQDVPTAGALVKKTFGLSERGGRATINQLSPFQGSKWHTRGWTLQELIAPRFVLFLSTTWHVLGTKADLAEQLTETTSIPAEVLQLQQTPADLSIAQRMAWAAHRTTTRIEDEAYCLLGIFDINMPTLYGEGRKAFRRLQEEIMRKTADTTLFAWSRTGYELSRYKSIAEHGLFAVSPQDFRFMDVRQESPDDHEDDLMSFSMTPRGVHAQIPIFELVGLLFADLSWSIKRRGEADVWDRGYLVLRPSSHTTSQGLRSLYNVVGQWVNGPRPETMIRFGTRTWKTVVIVADIPDSRHRLSSTPVFLPMTLHWSAPFRLSARVREMITAATNIDFPWSGHPPATLTCGLNAEGVLGPHDQHWVNVVIRLGRCSSVRANKQPLWANVNLLNNIDSYSHQCPQDHVLEWTDLTKSFIVGFYTARLHFVRCRWNPEESLVLDNVDGVYHQRWGQLDSTKTNDREADVSSSSDEKDGSSSSSDEVNSLASSLIRRVLRRQDHRDVLWIQ